MKLPDLLLKFSWKSWPLVKQPNKFLMPIRV
jgi:hypothetical protein